MVRHECAEALGAIGNSECMKILKEYLQDEQDIVRESCEVALDICDYEMSKEFQYADSLTAVGGVVSRWPCASWFSGCRESNNLVLVIVAIALLLDNMLLTTVGKS